MNKLFQFVVLSGKGGVGKTNVAAALAYQAAESAAIPGAVIVDADVDAANMSLLLKPHLTQQEPFFGGNTAAIKTDLCEGCGLCAEICRFDAVFESAGQYRINQNACEGCAACFYGCPQQAIVLEPHQDGIWAASYTRFGPLHHAELFPGKDNSGKLVSLIRQQAKESAEQHNFPLIIIDGPPGIGCPVISASTGTDLGIIVTEPSIAAIHDLERIHQTLTHFQIPSVLCINKVGINPQAYQTILTYSETHHLPIIGEIPYDDSIPKAMVAGLVVQELDPNSLPSLAVKKMWQTLQPRILNKE